MADSPSKQRMSDPAPAFAIELSPQQYATQQANRLADFGASYTTKGRVATQADGALVGSAATLLSVLGKLKQAEPTQVINKLQEELIHEIKSFEFECQSAHYHQDTILAARYILCVALDEAIEKSAWQQQWEPYRLVGAFQLEDWCGDGFFQLLENLSMQPKRHGELLELMYYCLSLGFEGKYRQIVNGSKQVNLIRDQLFQLIRDNHDGFELSLSELKRELSADKSKQTRTRILSWRLPLFTTVGLLLGYAGFSYLLNVLTAPALHHALLLSTVA